MSVAAAAPPTVEDGRDKTGFFCSTSGTFFSDAESAKEHYKSQFHLYNLKRKVAGLPPVTREWFDARKAQLASAASSAPTQRVWYDPLTRRKFMSEQTYLAHVRSKKYLDLVKQSGEPAPAPVVMLKRLDAPTGGAPQEQPASSAAAGAKPGPGFTVTPPSGGLAPRRRAAAEDDSSSGDEDGASSEGEGSGWETASDDDDVAGGEEGEGSEAWEEWDVRRSLFDNHVSASMEDNLEYMWRRFGFYLPDAEYLTDPEGLLRYLGTKLRYGGVPLAASGDDPSAKRFRSLHAVQRHMVDTNACRMLYDGNEDEYEDFYDYGSEGEEDGEDGRQLALGNGAAAGAPSGAASMELTVRAGGGATATKVVGSRDLARYYRQRPRPEDGRASVAANALAARYRALGIETVDAGDKPSPALKRAQRAQHRGERSRLNLALKTNVCRNLPHNDPSGR